MWYLPSSQSAPIEYTCKHFSTTGDLQGLLNEAVSYLNTYVAPHNLISFSVFEDDHPCPKQLCHAVVYHRGSALKPLAKPADVQGNIYSLKQTNADGWEDAADSAIKLMEKAGAEETRFNLSTYNASENDQKVIAIV